MEYVRTMAKRICDDRMKKMGACIKTYFSKESKYKKAAPLPGVSATVNEEYGSQEGIPGLQEGSLVQLEERIVHIDGQLKKERFWYPL